MPSPPADITALTLSGAKGDVLRFWIARANDSATIDKSARKPLTKMGKVDELKRKLAAYYNIDLAVIPAVPDIVGPLPVDEDIQKRQWSHLRELGQVWRQTVVSGGSFLLKASNGVPHQFPFP
jgi:hypothetical protein